MFYFCQKPVDMEKVAPQALGVLETAGDNREVLESVMIHYAQHPEDSLKLTDPYHLNRQHG